MGLLEDLAGFRPTPPVGKTFCQHCSDRIIQLACGEWVLYEDNDDYLCLFSERIPHEPIIEDQEEDQ